jgi:hypothetical protein
MTMFAVNGIYDGKSVKITDKLTEKKKFRVVVTFIEELDKIVYVLRDFSAQTNGLEFWENSVEDIYHDYLIPEKKVK